MSTKPGGVQVIYSRVGREHFEGSRFVRRELAIRASAAQLLAAVYF